MLIRFGFVAMSMLLEDASPSKTVTQKIYMNLAEANPEAALEKVRRTASNNLDNCLRLLKHCAANHVQLYRFSSKIIPLATHPKLRHWDYTSDLQQQLVELGRFSKEYQIRVSFHPDHFTLINSPKEEVFEAAIIDLAHHARIFNAMGLDNAARLVIHVGGGYNDKNTALERFLENWARVPNGIAKRLTLENDDKTFTAAETLYLCEKLQLPMVFDLHHYRCNHEEDSTLTDLFPRFITTWTGTALPPKIHVSSPKSASDLRSHHDYINPDDIYSALMQLRHFDTDIDAMVEAKQKDKALFRLVRELSKLPGITQVNDAAVRIP